MCCVKYMCTEWMYCTGCRFLPSSLHTVYMMCWYVLYPLLLYYVHCQPSYECIRQYIIIISVNGQAITGNRNSVPLSSHFLPSLALSQHMRAHQDQTALSYNFSEVIRADVGSSENLLLLRSHCLYPGVYHEHIEQWLSYYKHRQVYCTCPQTCGCGLVSCRYQ